MTRGRAGPALLSRPSPRQCGCRDRGVALDGELELHPGRVRELATELPQLLLGVVPNRLADLDVAALHLETHADENLADCPREGDDLDPASPSLAECRGGGGGRRPARVDVVDENQCCGRPGSGAEGALHVAAALRERQSALRANARRSGEQW